MKIKSIEVVNFKAIQNQEINLDGHSAIITGGNDKGKSSLLSGLINRFHGEKPDIIVKSGETKGSNQMELTDGSKIHWGFTEKAEKISFTTSEDIKVSSGVISAIGNKYFGIKFDIDKFIRSTTKEALKMVQSLLGVDLSELDKKYSDKYTERTDANRELKRIVTLNKQKPKVVELPDIASIRKRKAVFVEENTALKDKWVLKNKAHQKGSLDFNKKQTTFSEEIKDVSKIILELEKLRGKSVGSFIDFNGVTKYLNDIPEPKTHKEVTTLVEPKYHAFEEIDIEIETAIEDKAKFDTYEKELKEYEKWAKEGKEARTKANKLTEDLDKISEDKLKLIKEANLPEEFEMTDEGLLYNGFQIDNNQLSSSSKYICALKLGSLGLGKLRTMHFDCSFLDKNSLKEIMEWAESQDLQLLIEKPDFEAGEIKYNILENLSK